MKKVVFITGASSGIGHAATIQLLQQGYTVYAAARRVDKMTSLQAAGAQLIAMDVTDDDSMQKGVAEILKKEGRIDVLVNNAGYGSYGALEDVPQAEARYQFEVNIFGLARLIQLVLPQMRERKSGRIINISSIGGKIGEPHGSWYHATKFAVEGLSDSLRMELKQFNIDVVIIEPGAIKTEWNAIAREHLFKTSGTTAYKDLALKHINMLANADKTGASPDVVASYLVKSINAKKPKTRYAAGGGASAILLIRKLVSDRMFDRIMLGLMK